MWQVSGLGVQKKWRLNDRLNLYGGGAPLRSVACSIKSLFGGTFESLWVGCRC